MEENLKKICPKCGTELMEDNFCMGCGAYVEPIESKEKESSESYGSGSYDTSSSFGSFGSSTAVGAGGILGGGVLGENGVLGNGILSNGSVLGSSSGNTEGASDNALGNGCEGASSSNMDNPFGVDMASILGGIEPDQSFSGAGAASDADDNSSSAGNGYGYGSAGANSGYGAGYGASGNGYGSNGAGSSSGYAEGTSDKMPLMQSVLIMAAIAIVVFFGIFAVDAMTKLKDEITVLHSFDSEHNIEGTMSILATGDKVKQITEEERWNVSIYTSEEIQILKDYAKEYYASYDSYEFILWDVKEEGSNIVISVVYRDLDKKANIKTLVRLGIVEDGAGDYVSLKETVKSMKSDGWSDTSRVQAQ